MNESNAKWTEWLAELVQKNRRLAECVVAYWLGRGKLGESDVVLGLSAMPGYELLSLGVDTRKSVKAAEKRERELALSIGLGVTGEDRAKRVSSAERAAADAKELAERPDEFVDGYVRGLLLGKDVLDECLSAVTENLDDRHGQ